MEVAALRKHISLFESKITKSEKILQKRQDEHIKNIDQIEGAKIYELDIYGLDFLHNAMTDFLNNLEMSLHKFGYVEQEIENIRQHQSMLDFCENVCNRQIETQLCLHRVGRLITKGKALATHLKE